MSGSWCVRHAALFVFKIIRLFSRKEMEFYFICGNICQIIPSVVNDCCTEGTFLQGQWPRRGTQVWPVQGAFPENGVRHVYFSRVNGAFFAQNMFAHGKF